MARSRLALTLALFLATLPALADDVEDFYRGRNLTVMVGVGAGGEYDLQMRMVARHIGKQPRRAPQCRVRRQVDDASMLPVGE